MRHAIPGPRFVARAALVLLPLVSACSHGSPRPAAHTVANGQPDTGVDRLRADVAFLASPALEGRRAGTAGSDTAANYIARRLSELGLGPAFRTTGCPRGEGCRSSYFQLFHFGDIVSANVGAIIAGADSSLRDEFIAVTAHYDHIGRSATSSRDPDAGAVHPGADDNASGTAAMLELARRLQARPPRRSVILLAFGAEELGLVGSRAFVENPSIELRRIDLVLNLDMVGRLRKELVTIFGADSPQLRTLIDSANVESFVLSVDAQSSRRSDDYSFATHGVRALHVTTGEHPSYHRATDVVAGIDFGGMLRVTDFVERLARAAGDRQQLR
jgi:hypothetical protein